MYCWSFLTIVAGMLLVHQQQVNGEEMEVDATGETEMPRCPWAINAPTDLKRTRHTLSEYTVAGVNLATYGLEDDQKQEDKQEAEPYELYDSFDIGDLITGNEGWWQLLRYRQLLQRPDNCFYYDKVALKRWLPTIGIDTPRTFAIRYGSELSTSGQVENETKAIVSLFPSETDFVAKPSHMSLTQGTCIVSYDTDRNVHLLSTKGTAVSEEEHFVPEESAANLAKHLHLRAAEWESWTLQNVKPGVVIEERYTALHCYECPPPEFKIFVIWGRMWIAQLDFVKGQDRWCGGNFHRNGTIMMKQDEEKGNPLDTWLDWVDFPRIVDMAERLGAHKDMLRVDIFAGVPAGVVKAGATKEEKLAEVQYVVSEFSFHPTTMFDDDEIIEEGARLWLAGYKMDNYRVVTDTEVPEEFIETGSLPPLETA
jgi:hypothetical protein